MPPTKSSFILTATPVALIAHLLGATMTTLALVWILHYRGGIAFRSDNKELILNVHTVLMLIGFIFISGEAIMAYKTVPADRRGQKFVHMALHLIALLLGILGVYAAFKYHKETGLRDLYSLHSWLGISTICLFGLQWLFGFLAFWYPGARMWMKARSVPWHIFVGMVIFLMAICTAETGLFERFILLGLQHGKQALLVNFTGLALLLFGIAVALCILLPRS